MLLLYRHKHGLREAESHHFSLLGDKDFGADRVAPLVQDLRVCLVVHLLSVHEAFLRRASSSLVLNCQNSLFRLVSVTIKERDAKGALDLLLRALSGHIPDKEANPLADELLWLLEADVLDCSAAVAAVQSLNILAHVALVALDGAVGLGPDTAAAHDVELEVVAGGPLDKDVDAFDAGVRVQSENHVVHIERYARECLLVCLFDHCRLVLRVLMFTYYNAS